MSDLMLRMYDYHDWANRTMFGRLRELSDGVYFREVKSVFPSISSVISHMYIVDQLWFYIISGMDMPEALDVKKESGEGKSLLEMESLFRDLSSTYKSVLDKTPDADHSRLLHIPWEGERKTTFNEMVLHVITHGTYHRGNITAMLRQMGYASVTTDLTAYWFS